MDPLSRAQNAVRGAQKAQQEINKITDKTKNKNENKEPKIQADVSEVAKWLQVYRDAQREKAKHEDIMEMAKERVTALLEKEGANEGLIDGKVVCTWHLVPRTNFDTRKFRVEHPDLADKYTRVSESRTFSPKGD
jgi:predicted phage-related endonuclease